MPSVKRKCEKREVMETKLKHPELVQGMVSRYSYDAVDVPAEGGKEAGGAGADVRKLIVALEQTDHKGVAAHWIFGRDHHPRYGWGYRGPQSFSTLTLIREASRSSGLNIEQLPRIIAHRGKEETDEREIFSAHEHYSTRITGGWRHANDAL